MRAVWRHTKPFKRELNILVLLGIISAAANGFVPFITGRFFDTLIDLSQGKSTGEHLPLWMILLGVWALIQLVANNIDWILDRLRRKVDTKVHLNIQTSGFVRLLKLPISFHKNEHVNEVIEKISKAGWRVSSILRTIIQIAPEFLSIIIGIVLAASINTTLAGILAIGVVLYVLLLVRILIPIAKIDESAHSFWSKSWGDAAEAVHQIDSVKQASSEQYETEKVKASLLGKTYDSWIKLELVWSNISFFQRMIVFITQLAVFVISVQFISKGIITVGELVAFNGYALMFFGPFVSLGHSWQTIQNGLTSAAQAEIIFEEKTENYTPQGGVNLTSSSGAVAFQGVSFGYDANQQDVLESIDFTVAPGEIIALVGESGVGKSTLVSLISGYYFPTKGEVLVNGINTTRINLESLRTHIAVVPQEIALFNDTVMENIRYGTFNASDADVKRAAREAHLADFIELLPKKYGTLVGERGVKLSVGQKQRVAIARAILRNPSILILDEPTSALDSKTEKIITASLEKLMKGRTTFIIAHRLSTVRKADTILVFEKGKVVERGKHNELIKIENGVYRHLYEYQIGLRD